MNIEDVQGDLASFALGGQFPAITRLAGGWHRLAWTSRRQSTIATDVFVDASGCRVRIGANEISLATYLASGEVADLDVLAARTVERIPATPAYTDVEVEFELDDEHDAGAEKKGPGVELLTARALVRQPTSQTQVLFLRGAAGSGKSAMLRETTRRLASRWKAGDRSGPLALYVDAQAKALLSLDDAFASVLNDLDVLSLRKEAVAVLCRHGLVIPFVDGFDELLGAGGFGDAFNSLSGFLARLGGAGAIVASGRSTFYDQEQLQITASRYRETDYITTTINVQPWSPDRIQEFCRRRWSARDDADNLYDALGRLLKSDSISRLLGKPFFASQVADLLPVAPVSGTAPLIEQLVNMLITREAPKWVDRNKSLVLSIAEHAALLKEVALEMWWANRQELPVDSIRLVAEILADKAPVDHRPIIVAKAPMHGAFEPGMEGKSAVRFQHPIYFEYFLCKSLMELVDRGEPDGILAFLERGVLGESLLEVLGELTSRWGSEEVGRFIGSIATSMRDDGRYYAARLNAGAIAAAMLNEREGVIAGCSFRHFAFQRVRLTFVVLEECSFRDCAFEDVSMHGLILRNCSFDNCVMRRARIGKSTQFDDRILVGCSIVSLVDDDEQRQAASPRDVARMLAAHGAQAPDSGFGEVSALGVARRKVLDRLLRKMDRQFFFASDLEIRWGLNAIDSWPELKSAMLREGVLEERTLSKRGPEGTLFALAFTPSEIRDGESGSPTTPEPIRRLWEYIDS